MAAGAEVASNPAASAGVKVGENFEYRSGPIGWACGLP